MKTTIKLRRFFIFTILCGAILFSAVSRSENVSAEKKAESLPNLSGDEAKDYLKEQGLYNSLGEAMQAAKYSIYPTENSPFKNQKALHANNPRQGYSTYFSTDGVHLVSESAGNKWKIAMNLKQIGRGEDLQQVESGEMNVQANRSHIEIEKFRKGQGTSDEGREANKSKIQNPKSKIVEWYKNTSSGLEQGWTIAERLDDSGNELKLVLSVESDLRMKLASDAQAVDFVRENNSPVVRYDKLKSWDADGRELASRMEVDGKRISLVVDDKHAKYPITVDPFFTQTKKLTASDAAAVDRFGGSVSISGDTAIVGAYQNDDAGNQSGSAYIFERNSNGANMWGEVQKLTASDADTGDQFGWSVGISGDTVIVGAYGNRDAGFGSGSAYIFERNTGGANNWGEVQKLTASDAAEQDQFGISVGISNDTAIVGAHFNDDLGPNSGSAYIFERNTGGANNWGEVQKLTASNADSFDVFGYSVGISGDTAIVGAYESDDGGDIGGAAYIFERNTNGTNMWGEVQKLNASDATLGNEFGWSVGISGDTVIVGARLNDDAGVNSGAAYIFERNTNGANMWGEVQKLTASDTATGDQFGYSVGISGDTAIVGARLNDNGGDITDDSGSAYIFERNTGGANNWGEVQKLTASDAASPDQFGISVSIDGDTAIVGAALDDGAEGSAYIFKSQNNNWQEVTARTPTDGMADDNFGFSVAISGDTAIVGSPFNEFDSRFTDNGSAYIFERNRGGGNIWGGVRKIRASDFADGDEFGYSVAISGDTVIVGAYLDDDAGSASGSAYIFERNQGGADVWGQVKKITASDAAAFDQFGWSVAISGDTAIVGALGNDDTAASSGSVYIFERNSGGAANWGEVKKIVTTDPIELALFGYSVAISGDTAIVGARLDNNGANSSGAAYIFERNSDGSGGTSADNWGLMRKLTPADIDSLDEFGSSVSISGDTAIVGSPLDNTPGVNRGSAYIFERNSDGMGGVLSDNWGEVRKLIASDAADRDSFGKSVSISGDTVIVGAAANDDAGIGSGSAYIFKRNTGGADMWGEVTKLTASDAAAGDNFGWSVAISGDTVIIGANLKDIAAPIAGRTEEFRNATEINSARSAKNSANLVGDDQGGIYIFKATAAPTAASADISGRVLDANGVRGVPNTVVHLTEQNGTVRTARTNPFGYFRFDEIEVGQTVIINAYNKRYQFNSQVINLSDSISDLRITAQNSGNR